MYLRPSDISWDQLEGGDANSATALVAARTRLRSTGRNEGRHLNGLKFPIVDLHGVKLHAVTEKQCIGHILSELSEGRGGVVVTPNLDHLRRCVKDLNFGALVAEADLIVADGMPLVWASRIQGTPLPERVAGSNLISSLSASAAENGRSIYLLGGADGTAQGAADILKQRHPNLKIAGVFCPRQGFESKPKQVAEIAQKIVESKPDIIYIALGSPKQEHLIAKLRPAAPHAWWMGVGVSFSFLTGHVKRAPKWMQVTGIEWIHRLCQEPRRLFKRYIIYGIPFATNLMGRAAYRGLLQRLGWTTRAKPAKARPVVEVSPVGFLRTAATDHPEISPSLNERLSQRARRSAMTLDKAESTSLSRLKALVLLGGHVRPTALSMSIGRSLLDLPLDENGSVLNHWLQHAAELAKVVGLEKVPVRVMVDRSSPEPISAAVKYYGTFRVERDQSDFRGTGGVLGDMASRFDDDDLILVANAAQVLLDPLIVLVTSLDQKRGDISVISHRDGTPSGMMLVSCKTLRLIPPTGYVDMKEQAMPLIAQKFAVEVVHRRRPTGLPIRSVNDYITALRFYHMRRAGKTTLNDPLAEDWQPSFGIVEDGARVDKNARIHDSVVLRGGIAEAGSVLVRSVVCPGGVVRRDRTVVDEFICPVKNSRISGGSSISIAQPAAPALVVNPLPNGAPGDDQGKAA